MNPFRRDIEPYASSKESQMVSLKVISLFLKMMSVHYFSAKIKEGALALITI
jgi:hypothetical protein